MLSVHRVPVARMYDLHTNGVWPEEAWIKRDFDATLSVRIPWVLCTTDLQIERQNLQPKNAP